MVLRRVEVSASVILLVSGTEKEEQEATGSVRHSVSETALAGAVLALLAEKSVA